LPKVIPEMEGGILRGSAPEFGHFSVLR